MTHKKRRHDWESLPTPHLPAGGRKEEDPIRPLEVVIKADSRGTLEAVCDALSRLPPGGVEVVPIGLSVGDVSKSDVTMARTGSRLVVGFDVGSMPRIDELAKEQGVEVRLYDVIYRLTEDVQKIARSLVPAQPQERVLGQARVIALFKSSRKGSILGCQVLQGRIALGMQFRLIAPAGPVYRGVVESLRIGRDSVGESRPGQQVGLKIGDFQRAQIGFLVECFETTRPPVQPWSPRPGIHRGTG